MLTSSKIYMNHLVYISTFLLLDLNHASPLQFLAEVEEQIVLSYLPGPYFPDFGLGLVQSGSFFPDSYASNVVLVELVVVI